MSSRDHVIIQTATGKAKLEKHYLTMYLREAYAMFCDENPGTQVGYSTFCKYRPQNVLLLKETPKEQCLCEKHANFQFALDALGITYDESFWVQTLCETSQNSSCWNNTCKRCSHGKLLMSGKPLTSLTKRSLWKKQSDKRLQRITEEITIEQVMSELHDQWDSFVKHVNLKRIQFAEHKKDQETGNLRMLNVDFAMNFTPEPQQEIQKALWSRASVTLFTAAVEMNGVDQSFLIASDCKSKDKRAVITFLDYIYGQLPSVTDPNVTEVIWSDGAASEFKNQFMLRMLLYLAQKYNKAFTWKFFCTSHGKGKCDAIGGKAKMVVREKLLAQGGRLDAVNTTRDFVRIA